MFMTSTGSQFDQKTANKMDLLGFFSSLEMHLHLTTFRISSCQVTFHLSLTFHLHLTTFRISSCQVTIHLSLTFHLHLTRSKINEWLPDMN
jgi:hypothetical protein